ncbi:hypothetical protein ABBQ38_015178 [Trebouxia sp. C0009 RCD-2024]
MEGLERVLSQLSQHFSLIHNTHSSVGVLRKGTLSRCDWSAHLGGVTAIAAIWLKIDEAPSSSTWAAVVLQHVEDHAAY